MVGTTADTRNKNIKVGVGIGPESYIDDDRITQNKSPLGIAAT